jgi:hypothetical protein
MPFAVFTAVLARSRLLVLEQILGWTVPKIRSPHAVDRWTC